MGHLNDVELKVRHKNGTILDGLFSGDVVSSHGKQYLLTVMVDITERKRVEKALHESERELQAIFETVGVGIFIVDQETQIILKANTTALDMTKLPEEMIVGQSSTSLICLAEDGTYPVKDLGQTVDRIERRLVRTDGSVVDIFITVYPIMLHSRKCYIVSMVDISDQKKAERALKGSEERFRSIFEQSPIGIELYNMQGALVDANPACLQMFGVSDFTSVKGFRLFDDPNVPTEAKAEIHANRMVRYSTSFDFEKVRELKLYPTTRNGCIDLDVMLTPLKSGEPGEGYLSHVQDITEQKRLGKSILRLNADLEKRVEERTAELKAANLELDAFSYAVSHDLRAPLRALDGFSGILLSEYRDLLDDNGRHYIERIQKSVIQMNTLVTDLLNLSRLARMESKCRNTNISLLAQQVAGKLKSGGNGRKVEWRIAPGIEVYGDPNLLTIALDNLLGNAWKYSSRHECALIEFGVLEQDKERILFVRDNGVGFDMSYAGRLFTPFQRLHSAQEFPGSGIGLTTVKRIIARHGGRIWAESEVDKGATFFFTMPAGEISI